MVNDNPGPAPLLSPHISRVHPLVTREYSLFTPAIHEMAATIGGWIDDQVDGATIFGPSRFGKSNAVDHWLQRLLSERYDHHLPLLVWSHTNCGSAQSVGSFYSQLLAASRHPLATSKRNPLDRQHMLIERWSALAAQGGGHFLVLVIDEAQGMTQREWLWLVELHSLLEKQRTRLCVFSVASLQFFDEPTGMALSGGAHVAARFMLDSCRFHGVRSVEELAYVMSGYDEGTEWPAGSGLSYTAGIAPLAWSEGFRMRDQAGALMAAMQAELPARYAGPTEFPMKTVAQSCRHALLRLGSGARSSDVTSEASWLAIVRRCGHRNLMAVVSAAAPRLRARPRADSA